MKRFLFYIAIAVLAVLPGLMARVGWLHVGPVGVMLLSSVIITILFVLDRKPGTALRALISDKINQWTLLVGMIPLFVSLGAGRISSLPLDARQNEEFFLTVAQSLFALSLLLGLRLTVRGALALLALFLAQVGVAYAFQHDEPRTIQMLTGLAWVYLALALGLIVWNRARLIGLLKAGLWPAAMPQTESADERKKHLGRMNQRATLYPAHALQMVRARRAGRG